MVCILDSYCIDNVWVKMLLLNNSNGNVVRVLRIRYRDSGVESREVR